jgi:hypothetical protein
MRFTAELFQRAAEIFLQSLNDRFEFFVHNQNAPTAGDGGVKWSPRTATRA